MCICRLFLRSLCLTLLLARLPLPASAAVFFSKGLFLARFGVAMKGSLKDGGASTRKKAASQTLAKTTGVNRAFRHLGLSYGGCRRAASRTAAT